MYSILYIYNKYNVYIYVYIHMPDVAFNSHRVELLRNVQQQKFITCWPPKNMRRPTILPTFIAFVCQLQVQSLQILTSQWFLVIAKQSKCHHPSRVSILVWGRYHPPQLMTRKNFQPSSQTHQYSPIKNHQQLTSGSSAPLPKTFPKWYRYLSQYWTAQLISTAPAELLQQWPEFAGCSRKACHEDLTVRAVWWAPPVLTVSFRGGEPLKIRTWNGGQPSDMFIHFIFLGSNCR